MSTAASPGAFGAAATPPGPRLGAPEFGRLALAEWTKLRSVRSTVWSLALLVVITIGFTALITSITVANWSRASVGDQLTVIADPVGRILDAGVGFGQLTICVLGVLVISSEYSTGMIRASLLAVPRRTPMLAAKVAVFALLVLVVAEVVIFPAFFIGASILHSKVAVSLGDPGVLRAVVGCGLYLTVLGIFALAVGALIRHTAGGITGVIGLVLVLPPLAGLLPGSIGRHIQGYLPTAAGALILQVRPDSDQVLSSWEGFAVFCGWTALLLGLAGWLLNRRDA